MKINLLFKMSQLDDALKNRFVIDGEDIVFKELLETGDRGGKKALLYSIRDGEEEVALKLISYGADVHQCDGYGNSALHYCAFWKKVPMITVAKVLVEKGAGVDVLNTIKSSPLHLCCENDNVDMVRFLIDSGASLDIQDMCGCTPLHKACIAKSKDCIQLLLLANADTAIVNEKHKTPSQFISKDNDDLLMLFKN